MIKRYDGIIFGVCKTLSKATYFNVWILRFICIVFSPTLTIPYIILAILFSDLESNKSYKERKRILNILKKNTKK